MPHHHFRFSSQHVADLAVFVMRTRDGTHAGLLHRAKGQLRILHLCWHLCVRSDVCHHDMPCIVPALEEEELNDLKGMCRLVEDWINNGGTIPYAFAYRKQRFSQVTGELMLFGGIGLTCSTFVMCVFDSAAVELVDVEQWESRDGDDKRHDQLLDMMKSGRPGLQPADPSHVAAAKSQLPCIRVRPEEVAGAALFANRPVGFDRAPAAGGWLLELLTPSVEHAWI